MPIKLDEVYPHTLDEAIDILYNSLDDDELAFVKSEGVAGMHHGFGTAIRNFWGLWNKDSVLGEHFRTTYGLGHADDMSGLILGGLAAKVNGVEFDRQAEVARYYEHWANAGVDPLTLESV